MIMSWRAGKVYLRQRASSRMSHPRGRWDGDGVGGAPGEGAA
jgi:hypothetical protein